jgi:importin subunit alpha-1
MIHYDDDTVTKLLACVGLRKLLSIEVNPPI